jgi:hypothetical protein
MDPEKNVGFELREVSTRGSEQPKFAHSSVTEFVLPQNIKDPLQTKQAETSQLSTWINNLYDAGLIAAPILLAAKAGLVIAAHHHDKYKSGLVFDPPSPLTTYLIQFNSQVCSLAARSSYTTDVSVVSYAVYHNFHDFNSHIGQTIRTLERTERCKRCKLRAISSKH